MSLERMYSVPEAAEALRVSRWTISSWFSRGILTRTKCGSRTLVRESELLKLLSDGGKSVGRPRPKAV